MVHGGWSLAKVREIRAVISNDHLNDTVPAIVIGIGAFIFIISFIGCCGAVQGNVCLLETYSICLMILVLFQVILACFIFLFVDDIQKDTVMSFNKMWRTQGLSRDSRYMVSMIEENLECCGQNNVFDYDANRIPQSCCKRKVEKCSPDIAYGIGCKPHLQHSIRTSAQTISYVCIITAIFELCAAIMGFILSGYIRKVGEIRRCCY